MAMMGRGQGSVAGFVIRDYATYTSTLFQTAKTPNLSFLMPAKLTVLFLRNRYLHHPGCREYLERWLRFLANCDGYVG